MNSAHTQQALPERVIRPKKGLIGINLAELWRYRELFLYMAWRNILVRYKQTVIGLMWAVIRPVLLMGVFTVLFGKVAKFSIADAPPYVLITLAGIIPWQFFTNSINQGSNSLVANASMISKIYFPRLIAPSSAVLSGLVDFLVGLIILFAVLAYYGWAPPLTALWLPAFFLLALCASLGAGFWLSALNVKYRDVRHAVPFFIQFGVFITPVGYPSIKFTELFDRHPYLELAYYLNPMAGVADGFRWSLGLFQGGHYGRLFLPDLAFSAAAAVFLLISGAYYFRRVERTFADLI